MYLSKVLVPLPFSAADYCDATAFFLAQTEIFAFLKSTMGIPLTYHNAPAILLFERPITSNRESISPSVLALAPSAG